MAHAIEANDTTAAVGYADGSIALVCLETGQVVQMLSGHTHWITSLHMRPGLLVSGSCTHCPLFIYVFIISFII
jgi:WD40 repeat protein